MHLKHFVLGLVCFCFQVSEAQLGVARARQAYLTGFSSAKIENINERCILFDSAKLKFCREGFHASKVFTVSLSDYIMKPIYYGSELFFRREAALGYGIGAGENLERTDLRIAENLKRFYFLQGLRYYFVDGLGMGVFSPGYEAQKKAVLYCRSLPFSMDQALCFFGLGRASVFAQTQWFTEKVYGLRYSEIYHLRQGYLYAEIYANDDSGASLRHGEPGVLAAMQSKRMPISDLKGEYRQQQSCVRQPLAHHYLCALQILNPTMLFIVQ